MNFLTLFPTIIGLIKDFTTKKQNTDNVKAEADAVVRENVSADQGSRINKSKALLLELLAIFFAVNYLLVPMVNDTSEAFGHPLNFQTIGVDEIARFVPIVITLIGA